MRISEALSQNLNGVKDNFRFENNGVLFVNKLRSYNNIYLDFWQFYIATVRVYIYIYVCKNFY